ncbi:hypothetical protein [Amycolatopsis sp. DSM 110486]|uniref:hypothetical protein n=1 Tax=Amycolatopsis sp. DSM 110486 TaxID=2865832 RepID=UPI001C6A8D3E|nr:hypothetical protein [Amycolatopsis sp. DSM 110486]QYN20136.1 hypothetical protein K1T34_47590 [Amycolatopsis sp. DSM 110486]
MGEIAEAASQETVQPRLTKTPAMVKMAVMPSCRQVPAVGKLAREHAAARASGARRNVRWPRTRVPVQNDFLTKRR